MQSWAVRLVAAVGLLAIASTALAQSTSIAVRDRTGGAVAGATVEVLRGESIVATTKTDEHGAASLALEPGSYRARAIAPGFVTSLSGVFTPVAGAPSTAAVTLFPGSALAGTVLNDANERVQGAEVCLALRGWRDFPPQALGERLLEEGRHCVTSDARGQIVTPVLPLGDWELSIAADDLVPRDLSLTLERGFPAQIWRLARGGRIVGRVEDEQEQPVVGTAVRLDHRELDTARQTVTDDKGGFNVGGLAAGPWSVRVEPREAVPILRDGVIVKTGAATDLGVLRTRRGLDIRGRAIDANGAGVAKVKIQVWTTADLRQRVRSTESDEEGRFVAAGLGDDAVDLVVDPPEGHATEAVEEIAPPRRDLEIELRETGTVCGTVVTEDGEIAPGTSVTALPRDLGLLDLHEEIVRATTREVDAATGRFCIENVHPAEGVTVSATAAGYREASTRIDVAPGAEAGPVELTLERGLTLAGSVVGPDGQPLGDVAVRARQGAMVYTDGFGEFELGGLGGGMNRITATHPDFATAARDVMLPLPEGESFVIELGDGGTIEGSVRRRSGEGVEGVTVAVSPDREQRTDLDGRFRFENVAAGEVTVTRRAEGSYDDFEERRVEVAQGATVHVEFTLGAVLEGSVSRGGAPVPGASITLAQPADASNPVDPNHSVKRTFSDESGAYRLSGVHPGWGTVTVETGTNRVIRQLEVPPGDRPRRDLLLPDRLVTGVVRNSADDSGIGGAEVSAALSAADGAPSTNASSSYSKSDAEGGISYNLTSDAESVTVTDASGNFAVFVEPLPEVEVEAWAPGFRIATVAIDPADSAPVVIELSKEVRLVVRLQDTQGRPVQDTRVCAVLRASGDVHSMHCSHGGVGEVVFTLAEATYRIQAAATGFGTQVLERELKPRDDGSAETIAVTLVPGAPLALRLVGRPMENTRVVSLIDAAGADRTALVEPSTLDPATGDLRWSTWPLEPGLWIVVVDPGDGKAIGREVEVVPGPPIEVTLP